MDKVCIFGKVESIKGVVAKGAAMQLFIIIYNFNFQLFMYNSMIAVLHSMYLYFYLIIKIFHG
jgi:hypothetical protein